jgi:O-antigen/teichoic acid export membrane protein
MDAWREFLHRAGRDAGWSLALEVSVVISALITFLALTTQLGPVPYGYYAGIMGLTAVVATFGGGWVSMVVMQDAVRDRLPLDPVARSATSWTLIAGVAALVAGGALGRALLPHLSMTVIIAFIAAEVVGDQLAQLTGAVVVVRSGFAAAARVKVVYVWVTTAVIAAQWATDTISLLNVAIGQLIASVAVGVGSVVWCWVDQGVKIRPGQPQVLDVKRGTLYTLVLGSFAMQEDVDKTLLVHFRKLAAGSYAAAYNIVQVALLPLRAALSATHWRFLVHDEDAIGQHRRRSVLMTMPAVAYAVIAAVGLAVFAPLVPHVLGHQYVDIVVMIRALSLYVVLRSISLFPFNGLLGLGRAGWRTAIVVTSAMVNLGLNLALIPSFSWKGAVIATLGSETVFAALSWTALLVFQARHDRMALLRLAASQPLSDAASGATYSAEQR